MTIVLGINLSVFHEHNWGEEPKRKKCNEIEAIAPFRTDQDIRNEPFRLRQIAVRSDCRLSPSLCRKPHSAGLGGPSR